MPWMPPGFILNLERMHSRLDMDLGMFSPWMAKERIKLYLYKDSHSYVSGEFNPPSWSNGLALFEIKSVAVPDQTNRKALMRVISHETTHLLFEGYWHEAGKSPPSWLNEGLAMMEEEESPDHPERAPWFQNMVMAKPGAFLPIAQFFTITPTTDLHDNQESIGNWYVQAFSMVYFLYRGHQTQRLQFKTFCANLRDGKSLEESLWISYRYRNLNTLDKDWRRWLSDPQFRRRVEAALAAEPPEPQAEDNKVKDGFSPGASKFKPMKGFKSLRD